MFNKALPIVVAALAWSASGQSLNHKIDLPKDSPVSLLLADFGNSNVIARGANQIEVNASLSLRNSSQKRIRSMTLMVFAQMARPAVRDRWRFLLWMRPRAKLFRSASGLCW